MKIQDNFLDYESGLLKIELSWKGLFVICKKGGK